MNRIAELRSEKNLTLRDLEKITGIKNNAISQYEHGIRNPRSERWDKLAEALDVPVPYLMGLSNQRYSLKLFDSLLSKLENDDQTDVKKMVSRSEIENDIINFLTKNESRTDPKKENVDTIYSNFLQFIDTYSKNRTNSRKKLLNIAPHIKESDMAISDKEEFAISTDYFQKLLVLLHEGYFPDDPDINSNNSDFSLDSDIFSDDDIDNDYLMLSQKNVHFSNLITQAIDAIYDQVNSNSGDLEKNYSNYIDEISRKLEDIIEISKKYQ